MVSITNYRAVVHYETSERFIFLPGWNKNSFSCKGLTMKSLFRFKGAAAFVLITALIILFWWLLADWLLKQGIERSGSSLLKTQVELQSAQLQLSPLGFELHGLQITDPDNPMQNMLSATTVGGYLQLMPLLMGQIIITELKADALQFNSPRTTPGIIPKTAEKTPSKEELSSADEGEEKLFEASLPSVDELLERLPITTIKLAKTFDNDAQQAFKKLDQQISELPDNAALADYEQRLKQITEGKIKSPQDLKQRIADLKQLKAELKQDRETLAALRDNIKETRQQLSSQWKALKAAPAADLELLKKNYGLNGSHLGNISGLLFGDKVQYWVTMIEPYLKQAQRLTSSSEAEPPPPPRGEGRLVHFATDNPRPDFLIQRAVLNIILPIGELELTANNVTHQPTMIDSPITLHITGRNLKQIAAIDIEGVFDYRSHDNGFSKITGTAQQWQLKQITLSKSNEYPIIISSALQAIEGELLFQNNQLQADINSHYTQVNWGQPEHASTLQQLLSHIEDFDLLVGVNGGLTSPEIKLRSNLDKRLSSAFKQQLTEEQKALEAKFSARLNQQIEQRGGRYSEQFKQLDLQQGSLEQSLEKLEQMLASEIKNGLDEKKDEVKEKLKDKLRDKFNF